MIKAIWNGVTIAESDDTVVVEGNHYFPRASVAAGVLTASATTSVCGWKGTANYYDVVAGDQVNCGAAWVYRTPQAAASHVAGHIAFWKGVTVG